MSSVLILGLRNFILVSNILIHDLLNCGTKKNLQMTNQDPKFFLEQSTVMSLGIVQGSLKFMFDR